MGRYFVGREAELKTLSQCLAGLAAGQPSHAFVAGVHGTGKSSFLDKAVAIAKSEGFVGAETRLDDGASAIVSIRKILRATVVAVEDSCNNSARLVDDWDSGAQSTFFRQAKSSELDSDAVLADLKNLSDIARDNGAQGIVLCIDEGQRVPPAAITALKNALERESRILVILSLRLVTEEVGARKGGRALLDEIASGAEGDYGASRLFVTELGMGPFATSEEAHRCITKRLEDNTVDFDFTVIQDICDLSERVPREIISYANKVWTLASQAGGSSPVATSETLAAVFREVHILETDRALGVVSRLSGLKQTILRTLLTLGGRASIEDLVGLLHDERAGEREVLERAVEGELADLEAQIHGLTRQPGHQDTFEIPRSIDVFALRLALEEL